MTSSKDSDQIQLITEVQTEGMSLEKKRDVIGEEIAKLVLSLTGNACEVYDQNRKMEWRGMQEH